MLNEKDDSFVDDSAVGGEIYAKLNNNNKNKEYEGRNVEIARNKDTVQIFDSNSETHKNNNNYLLSEQQNYTQNINCGEHNNSEFSVSDQQSLTIVNDCPTRNTVNLTVVNKSLANLNLFEKNKNHLKNKYFVDKSASDVSDDVNLNYSNKEETITCFGNDFDVAPCASSSFYNRFNRSTAIGAAAAPLTTTATRTKFTKNTQSVSPASSSCSPNSLSAKYRSLIMITKDNSNGTTSSSGEFVSTRQKHDILPVSSIVSSGVVHVASAESESTVTTNCKGSVIKLTNNYSNTKIPQYTAAKSAKNATTTTTIKTDFKPNANSMNSNMNVNEFHIVQSDESPRSVVEENDNKNVSNVLSVTSFAVDQERIDNHEKQQHFTYGSDDDEEELTDTYKSSSTRSRIPSVCLEDGLADDDSWVEEVSQHGDDFDLDTTPTASDSEDLSVDDDDSSVLVNSMFIDREEELRGYHRSAIDFTLHTIVEESCEESEVASLRDTNDNEELDEAERRRQRTINHHNRLSASDLEKYFFFGLGDGKVMSSIDTRGDDTASEVSSECSEGLDSLGIPEEPMQELNNATELASSRLEKYFLSGFMGFNANEKNESDESGSVGSDSEGHPSPSQRRKRLVRARGTPRSHNSSLDNLLVDGQSTMTSDSLEGNSILNASSADVLYSSESEACDDTVIHVSNAEKGTEANSSSSDTIKRKKQIRKRHDSLDEKRLHESTEDPNKPSSATTECRTPTPGSISSSQNKKQQHHSRDSGFVGSNDDLLKSSEYEIASSMTLQVRTKSPSNLEQITEDKEIVPTASSNNDFNVPIVLHVPTSLQSDGLARKPPLPPNLATNLVRKDSFNNWSSDEETNLMMSKMRQFFKTLVVATANAQQNHSSASNSKGPTPNQTTPTSVRRQKSRPAQLAYFENELTRLMKTVPGINEEQVREIVEYLSSEDTWSDSYDSSDYTSSDLEGSARKKVELKQQISDSCQQIINKFEVDEEGIRGDGGLLDETHALNSDTALVYQKLVASFSKIAVGNVGNQYTTVATVHGAPNFDGDGDKKDVEEDRLSNTSAQSATSTSPQLFAKVMQHIGTRLVALMHEVNSGNDSHGTNSPMPLQRQQHHHHKRLQAKISVTTTEDEEESTMEASQSRSARLQTPNQQKTSKQQDDANNLARSKSHDLLLDSASTSAACISGSSSNAVRPHHHQSSSGVSDTTGEECGVASDYERFSWRGSFESALLANGDSRTKLSQLDRDNSSSASALAVAKRRSAGDLLFNHKSLSREQLDRVRSCGSIGGGDERHQELEVSAPKPWLSAINTKDVRRSSVPDAIYESDSSEEGAFGGARSTLPRSLTSVTQVASTNSLPRLPTTSATVGVKATSTPISKSQSSLNYTPTSTGGSAKSARYRSPGLANRANSAMTNKKSSSTLGLHHFLYSKRDARKRLNMSTEEAKAASDDLNRSPIIGNRNDSATSPNHSRGSASSETWPVQSDEDIDRLVAMHQNRASLSSLGLRSDSMASVYSGAGEGRYGTVVVKGQVEFGMQYNYKLGALEIHVVRCKDLAAVDTKRNRSDPYVKVYLLPDKSKAGKRKTKVKKHTLNPIFDEVLRFHMPISNLESRTLWLTVWHSDMFGRNDFLGEVSVNLQGKVFDNPQSQWYLLQERSEPFDDVATYRGDIVVGLKFIPRENVKGGGFARGSTVTGSSSNLRKFGSIKSVTSKADRAAKGGQLHVLVKEAKHLSPVKANGTCDAFCKSYLLPDRTRSSKQKTPVVKRTLHPSWNYTFVYEDISLEDLSERALELTVWDHDRLASNEFIGGIRFSLGTGKSYGRHVDWMDATGKELSLWQNMLDRPNFWVEGSLVLRSSLDGIRSIP